MFFSTVTKTVLKKTGRTLSTRTSMGLCRTLVCLSGFKASNVLRNDWNPEDAGGTQRLSRLVASACASFVNRRRAGNIVQEASSTLEMKGETGDMAMYELLGGLDDWT